MESRAKPRIFLDSNVIVSGLYSPTGAPGIILQLLFEDRLKAVISQQVIEEVARAAGRKLLARIVPQLDHLYTFMEILENPTPKEVAHWSSVINAEDAGILAAAVAAQPDYLVTGDRAFLNNLRIVQESDLQIVTPRQLLQIVTSQR